MQPLLALQLYTAALVAVAAACVVVLVLVVVGPSRRVREEPPLDPEVEARLLLHQDPEEPTGETPAVSPIDAADHESGGDDDIGDLRSLEDLAAFEDASDLDDDG